LALVYPWLARNVQVAASDVAGQIQARNYAKPPQADLRILCAPRPHRPPDPLRSRASTWHPLPDIWARGATGSCSRVQSRTATRASSPPYMALTNAPTTFSPPPQALASPSRLRPRRAGPTCHPSLPRRRRRSPDGRAPRAPLQPSSSGIRLRGRAEPIRDAPLPALIAPSASATAS